MSCCCAPSCAVPSCPQPCCPSPCCPPSCCGGPTPARCLGIARGASVGCVTQIPPSEVTIKPPPCIMVVPGAILAASCEPMRVGGYTACGGCPPCGCMCPC